MKIDIGNLVFVMMFVTWAGFFAGMAVGAEIVKGRNGLQRKAGINDDK